MPLQGTRTIKYELGELTVEKLLELVDQLKHQSVDLRARVKFETSTGQRDSENTTVTIQEPLIGPRERTH